MYNLHTATKIKVDGSRHYRAFQTVVERYTTWVGVLQLHVTYSLPFLTSRALKRCLTASISSWEGNADPKKSEFLEDKNGRRVAAFGNTSRCSGVWGLTS